jgi:PAS domain S-box-containing protein
MRRCRGEFGRGDWTGGSSHRESELKAVDAALASAEAVLVADDQGRYVAANDAAGELLGYTAEELVELSVWDLTPGANELDGLLLWQDFIGLGFQAGVYWLARKDGSLIEVAYRATANVAPGRHVSQLSRHDSLNAPFERSRFPRRIRIRAAE